MLNLLTSSCLRFTLGVVSLVSSIGHTPNLMSMSSTLGPGAEQVPALRIAVSSNVYFTSKSGVVPPCDQI